MFSLLANSLWTQLLEVAAKCRQVSAAAKRSKGVQEVRTQSALGADTYSNTNKENNNRKWKQSQQRQRKGQRAGQSERKRGEREGGESGNNSWQSDSSPGIKTWQHRLLAMASQNALPPKPNVLKRLDPKCLDPSTN